VEQIPAITYLDVVRKETTSSYPTVYISPQVEKVLGVTPQEWIEDPALWLHLLHPEDRERMIEADVQTNLNGQPFSQEYRMIARDGRTVWIKDDAVMLRDARSGDQYWHGVMQDVTSSKVAEAALRKALEREREASERLHAVDEMKNAFLSAVSHELRTPLTVLIGTSDTLARHADTLSREEIQSFGSGLYNKAKELDRLLADLLDLERLRTGTTTITATPADLEALANAVVASSGVARTHPVEVSVSCPIVWVDVFKIERILHNLLVNAAKHTAGGTQVWVRIGETDRRRPDRGGGRRSRRPARVAELALRAVPQRRSARAHGSGDRALNRRQVRGPPRRARVGGRPGRRRSVVLGDRPAAAAGAGGSGGTVRRGHTAAAPSGSTDPGGRSRRVGRNDRVDLRYSPVSPSTDSRRRSA
jgi:PAS domain S-box-containing protein